jgi:hypothetical protein
MRAQIDQYKIHVRSLTADSVSEQLVDLELILATEYQVTIGRRGTGQLAEERLGTIHIQCPVFQFSIE